jgi:L-lactate dehydrogenase complex protein LldG
MRFFTVYRNVQVGITYFFEVPMLKRFLDSAEAVGATVKRIYTIDEAREYLADLAKGGAVTTSSLPEDIGEACAALRSGANDPATATLCVSRAEAGIAATGTLLIDLKVPADRAATALAPKHAVFLDPTSIVPTLRDLDGRLRQFLADGDQAYFSLTTGPSRTADIERVLTIGVHGAKELHILIMEERRHG